MFVSGWIKSLLIAAGFLSWSGIISAATLDAAATKSLLQRIEEARRQKPSLQADFREEKAGGILARPAVSSGKMWWQAPDKFRRETTGGGKSGLIVSNGELLWMYYPAYQEVERYDLKKKSFLNKGVAAFTAGLGFQNIERDYQIAAEETTKVYIVTLTPRTSAIGRMIQSLVIALGKNLDLQSVKVTTPKGEITTTRFENLRATPIPDSEFDFQPPEGTSISTPLGK